MVQGLNDASLGFGVWSHAQYLCRKLFQQEEEEEEEQGETEEAREAEEVEEGERHTSNDLWTLKVLIRMDITRLKSHIQANHQQRQIDTRPHCCPLN